MLPKASFVACPCGPQIPDLQQEIAILQTARNAYAQTLAASLPKN
tara:strand:+ start:36466 stop:36600 length:135 start_codon:yes stop_codon:yes gene_type:complete